MVAAPLGIALLATEDDTVYRLSAAAGGVAWR
jgi:hypothetical protein